MNLKIYLKEKRPYKLSPLIRNRTFHLIFPVDNHLTTKHYTVLQILPTFLKRDKKYCFIKSQSYSIQKKTL